MKTQSDIIEALYEALSQSPKPDSPGVYWKAEMEELLSQNLRTSNPRLIRLVIEDCMITFGDAVFFKYYMPRILELSVVQKDFYWLHFTFFRRVLEAGYYDWPNTEQAAFMNFVRFNLLRFAKGGRLGEFSDWFEWLLMADIEFTVYLDDIKALGYTDFLNSFLKAMKSYWKLKKLSKENNERKDGRQERAFLAWREAFYRELYPEHPKGVQT